MQRGEFAFGRNVDEMVEKTAHAEAFVILTLQKWSIAGGVWQLALFHSGAQAKSTSTMKTVGMKLLSGYSVQCR